MDRETFLTEQKNNHSLPSARLGSPSSIQIGTWRIGILSRSALLLTLALVLSGCNTMPVEGVAGYGGLLVAALMQDAHDERAEAERRARDAESKREREAQAQVQRDQYEAAVAAQLERQAAEAEAERERRAAAAAAAAEAERLRAAERQRQGDLAREERRKKEVERAKRMEEQMAQAREILDSQMASRSYRPFPLTDEDAAAKWVGQRLSGMFEAQRSGNPVRLTQVANVHDLEIDDLVGKTVTYDFQPTAPRHGASMMSRDEVWVGIEKPVDSGGRVLGVAPILTGLLVRPIRLEFGEQIDRAVAAELSWNSKIRLTGTIVSADYTKDSEIEDRLTLTRQERLGGLRMLRLKLTDIQVVQVTP